MEIMMIHLPFLCFRDVRHPVLEIVTSLTRQRLWSLDEFLDITHLVLHGIDGSVVCH